MELSREDRDRIYQEEKARHEAQQRIKAEEKKKADEKATKVTLGCLGLIVIFGAIVALTPESQTNNDHKDEYGLDTRDPDYKNLRQMVDKARSRVNLLFNKASEGDSEAIKELTLTAEQGGAEAQFALGKLYYSGAGVPRKDVARALKLIRNAANQGLPEAEHLLGLLYVLGDGVKQSSVTATGWFKKAAEHGFADAQYYLGDAYCYGKGVAKDVSQAQKWWKVASGQGHQKASEAYARGCPEGL